MNVLDELLKAVSPEQPLDRMTQSEAVHTLMKVIKEANPEHLREMAEFFSEAASNSTDAMSSGYLRALSRVAGAFKNTQQDRAEATKILSLYHGKWIGFDVVRALANGSRSKRNITQHLYVDESRLDLSLLKLQELNLLQTTNLGGVQYYELTGYGLSLLAELNSSRT